jgi:hypothetical protein
MGKDSKVVFLHVGCRKSGTTTLQLGLRLAADQIRSTGLEQPLGARGGIMQGLVDPLRNAIAVGDIERARPAVEGLAELVRESPYDRHIVSIEALAEMPVEATRLVVEALAEFDTHVIVTLRPYALTIPSEWQQLVKSRFTGEYPPYARAIAGDAETDELAAQAEAFRRRQDVADVVRRWRAADAELPVHVILVPQGRETRPDAYDLFCEVVGLDRQLLVAPDRVVNPSISHADAEVLRLLNQELGDHLANTRGNYRYSVRNWIAVNSMMRGSTGTKIRLPRELEEWATLEAQRQVAEVRGAGCEVLGDAQSFATPSLSGDDFVPATDAEVARAAAAVLANLAQRHDQQRRRERRQARQLARKRAQQRESRAAAADAAPARRTARAVRSLPRRLTARMRQRGA